VYKRQPISLQALVVACGLLEVAASPWAPRKEINRAANDMSVKII
jgi:hypothetical protein